MSHTPDEFEIARNIVNTYVDSCADGDPCGDGCVGAIAAAIRY